MKKLIFFILLSLSACTTVTETKLDGTVVKTKTLDFNLAKLFTGTTVTVLPILTDSGK